MKTNKPSRRSNRAFTLLEMTVAILVMLTLIKLGFTGSQKMNEWKMGRAASEELRVVYSAQRMYLADNPTTPVSSLTSAMLLPYMQGNVTVMPTIKPIKGTALQILVNVSPPIINSGNGSAYDPSGSSTDSLWDVGE